MISKDIMYDLTRETAILLNKSQQQLKNIKWNDNEANLDGGYSALACDCCCNAWNNKYSDLEITIICKEPDINIKFIDKDNNEQYEKIELKSSLDKIIPGSTIRSLDIINS